MLVVKKPRHPSPMNSLHSSNKNHPYSVPEIHRTPHYSAAIRISFLADSETKLIKVNPDTESSCHTKAVYSLDQSITSLNILKGQAK